MSLSEKQAIQLNIPFGYALERISYHSPAGAWGPLVPMNGKGRKLSLREVLDLALDQELALSQIGAKELQLLLNQKLPPVWPGESPIQFDVRPTQHQDACQIVIPERFHNRLHRFPFVDGFLVCPVPECTEVPRLRGIVYSSRPAANSYVMEHICDAGHHWQTQFLDEEELTRISIIRLRPRN
jgi:hypothetical protein